VDLVIAEHDVTLCGQAARAVAVDYRLLPVALLANDGKASARPLTAQLGPGDRLVALITLPDLQKLLRREAVPKDRSVEVKAFPLPARDWLAGLVKTQKGLSAEEAEKALDHLPLTLGAGLTRGQAEDLLARLVRERITAVSQGGRP
jgi:hypothetical protein